MKHRNLIAIMLTLLLLLMAACAPDSSPTDASADVPQEEAADDSAVEAEGEAEDAPEAAEDDAAAEDASADAGEAETAGVPIEAVTYVIVPDESSASYIADEEFFRDALSKYGINVGTQDTVGTTSAIEGEFTLNWSNLSGDPLGSNSFTVDLSTLESDQRLRDQWLRENGPEFNAYPEATFVATDLRGGPDVYTMGETVEFQLVGELSVRDVPQPATFLVEAALNGDTVTGTATTTALMSNFGIEPPDFANTLTVADEFEIEVTFTARAQE